MQVESKSLWFKLALSLKLTSSSDDLMTKEIAREELRSNYLSFLHPFLEVSASQGLAFKTEEDEVVGEDSKKRKLEDEADCESEEKSSDDNDQNPATSPSKKRKLQDLIGSRPLWDEVKSRSFAKGKQGSHPSSNRHVRRQRQKNWYTGN